MKNFILDGYLDTKEMLIEFAETSGIENYKDVHLLIYGSELLDITYYDYLYEDCYDFFEKNIDKICLSDVVFKKKNTEVLYIKDEFQKNVNEEGAYVLLKAH